MKPPQRECFLRGMHVPLTVVGYLWRPMGHLTHNSTGTLGVGLHRFRCQRPEHRPHTIPTTTNRWCKQVWQQAHHHFVVWSVQHLHVFF